MPKAGSASAPRPTGDALPSPAHRLFEGTLGPNRRLRKSDEFAAILKGGQRGRSAVLSVALMPARGGGRIGVSASTKVGGSVGRNRARRLVKESFRKAYRHSAPYDIVVSVNPAIQGSSAEQVRQALDEAISNATARRSSHRRPADPRH